MGEGSESQVSFRCLDGGSVFEVEKNYDVIVFGVGVSRADVISSILMNDKEEVVVLSPLQVSDVQQDLVVICSNERAKDIGRAW